MNYDQLTLNSAGSITASELLHIRNTDTVKVADDGVFQAGSSHGKLQRLLFILVGVQAVDQAAGEAVTATHTVDDVADLIFL